MNLPDDVAEELLDAVKFDLISRHIRSDNSADYSLCEFCGSSQNDFHGRPEGITHQPNCLGIRLIKLLTPKG